jgi:hypothetical protein
MKLCVLLALVLAVGVALMGCSSSLPRRSEQSIRERILRDTPLGSTHAVVLDYAKRKGWPVIEQPGGYVVPEIGKSQAQSKIVGKRVIRADLGEYQGLPWKMAVLCYWSFDGGDKLVDVFIEKQADAP